MTRVLIADDQEMVRAGFGALLDAEPDLEVVGLAADGVEAVELALELAPDVVLMDVRMPRRDGIEATRQIAAQTAARVLILTTFDLDEYVYDALHAGASGFLLKHAPPAELVGAVRVVAAGEALLAPSVTRRLIEDVVRRRPTVGDVPPDGLTERETEVLKLVARGLSNAEIAAELVLSEQTVKSHVSRIYAELGLRDRAQAVVYAYERALVGR